MATYNSCQLPMDLSFINPVMWLYKFLQEAVIKKKYGGLLPKKNPLISKVNDLCCCIVSNYNFSSLHLLTADISIYPIKDHERAFFDSADWALGKVCNGILLWNLEFVMSVITLQLFFFPFKILFFCHRLIWMPDICQQFLLCNCRGHRRAKDL